MSNLTQVVNTDKNMKTLKKGMHASDLDQLLSSTGPYTFFAPTDTAFEKLDVNTMTNLLHPDNKAKLADLLNNHIVKGRYLYQDFKDGDTLTTLNGRTLEIIVRNGSVHIGKIQVLVREAKVSNGVLHVTDTVMV